MTGMEIGEMNYAKAVEGTWEIGKGHVMLGQLQPSRFDMPGVSDTRPIAADPTGPAAWPARARSRQQGLKSAQ
jgi:hypothetical protein